MGDKLALVEIECACDRPLQINVGQGVCVRATDDWVATSRKSTVHYFSDGEAVGEPRTLSGLIYEHTPHDYTLRAQKGGEGAYELARGAMHNQDDLCVTYTPFWPSSGLKPSPHSRLGRTSNRARLQQAAT